MLFKNYDSIDYKIGGRTVKLVDIFKNIAFVNIENSKAYQDYYVQDGETPETVAVKLYGTTELSWLVMLVNNFTRIQDDWFVSQEEENRRRENILGGDAFYISALPDIKPGDVMVKVTATGDNGAISVDATTYRHVAEFDPYFRKIRGICGSGTFQQNDAILFARQNTSNGTVIPLVFKDRSDTNTYTNYTDILLTEIYTSSPLYFYNSFNVVIDPYRYSSTGATSINSNTLYLDTSDTTTTNNFARCLLYQYGLCGGTPPENLYKKTVTEDINDKYLSKQKIKVLKNEYARTVVNSLENALRSDTIGKKIRIEI